MKMYLAIPAERLEIKGNATKFDCGEGAHRDTKVVLVDAKVEEYVSVRPGYAIQVIDRKAAEENA